MNLYGVRSIVDFEELRVTSYKLQVVFTCVNLHELENYTNGFGKSETMPVLFIGHGSPMNALRDNNFTRNLNSWGQSIALRPEAILVISAHWLSRGTYVMRTERPETIHDFGGFPAELYQVQYPVPGAPEKAILARDAIKSIRVAEDFKRGLDHGAWTILMHLFPDASIPVFQLSIDYHQSMRFHYDLGRELNELRKKGVLIIGSGNIVHNLYQVDFDDRALPFQWATDFDETIKAALQHGNHESLINYQKLSLFASLAVPTPDHYIPMIYILGLAESQENVVIKYEEIQNASVSMLSFQIGS
jgi:4,5-DOPA dioxygenase extradiol